MQLCSGSIWESGPAGSIHKDTANTHGFHMLPPLLIVMVFDISDALQQDAGQVGCHNNCHLPPTLIDA